MRKTIVITVVLIGGMFAWMGFNLADAQFTSQFTGTPLTPQPFTTHGDYSQWNTIVHSRDTSAWDNLETMQAEHGGNCAGPPATHENHTYEGANFVCNDHLMTAIMAGGYGLIYLTPNQMLDWTNGPATLTFDLSTHKSSTRDWVDLWLQEFNGNVAEPLDNFLPDLQAVGSPGGNNIPDGHQYLHLDTQGNRKGFSFAFSNGNPVSGWNSFLEWAADSATQRDTFQLTINSSTFSFCKITGEPQTICWANNLPHGLTATKMTVQLGHHSYNPRKDGAGIENTWHWDNVTFNPSAPLTMIHAAPNLATPLVKLYDSGVVNFASPAPANAFLRFAAVGAVTLNGSLVAPVKPTVHLELANNYFVPIPADSTSAIISLSPQGWYQGPFMAEGFSVWAQESAPPTTPTPILPTNTPAPATPTIVPPTATVTNTPLPPTPTNTPNPGPTRQCTLRWGNNTIESYGNLTQAECAARGQ